MRLTCEKDRKSRRRQGFVSRVRYDTSRGCVALRIAGCVARAQFTECHARCVRNSRREIQPGNGYCDCRVRGFASHQGRYRVHAEKCRHSTPQFSGQCRVMWLSALLPVLDPVFFEDAIRLLNHRALTDP